MKGPCFNHSGKIEFRITCSHRAAFMKQLFGSETLSTMAMTDILVENSAHSGMCRSEDVPKNDTTLLTL